jgi:hypothetical protein
LHSGLHNPEAAAVPPKEATDPPGGLIHVAKAELGNAFPSHHPFLDASFGMKTGSLCELFQDFA